MRNNQSDRKLLIVTGFTFRPCVMLVLALMSVAIAARPVGAKRTAGAAGEPAGVSDRDWKLHPAIVVANGAAELYALGDTHGDYERLAELLAAAKLISPAPAAPDAVKWTGKKAVLVCTGDMIDKYPHSMQVIAFMRALQTDAEKAGGRVIVTLGNHEAEFLGAFGEDKKGAEFETELKAAGIVPDDVAAGRDSAGIGAWLRNLPAGAKVGDWFFCHGGNTGGKTLDALGAELEKEITEEGFKAQVLSDPNSMLEARMHPRPWWDAGSDPSLKDVEQPEKKEQKKAERPKNKKSGASVDSADKASGQRLLAIVSPLGARHLVFGHQPGRVIFADGTVREQGQMFTKFDGLLFMIDTGMSRGVDSGRGAVLRISAGKTATAVYADGTSLVLWE